MYGFGDIYFKDLGRSSVSLEEHGIGFLLIDYIFIGCVKYFLFFKVK
jgi:hypothetical protein